MYVEVVFLDKKGNPEFSRVVLLSDALRIKQANHYFNREVIMFPIGIDVIPNYDYRSDFKLESRAARKADIEYCKFMETTSITFKKLVNKYGYCNIVDALK